MILLTTFNDTDYFRTIRGHPIDLTTMLVPKRFLEIRFKTTGFRERQTKRQSVDGLNRLNSGGRYQNGELFFKHSRLI